MGETIQAKCITKWRRTIYLQFHLAITGRSHYSPIISEWHNSGLEYVLQVARSIREPLSFSFPIPKYNLFVIRTRYKEVTSGVEF
jgi:hypothetical protein